MQDKELFQTLLGLKTPWTVARVELTLERGEVHVHVEHGEVRWSCPECEQVAPLYDHGAERVWRHLDTMQYTTLLHAETPRVKCSKHGVRSVRVPWGEPNSRFTLLFEMWAIEVLLRTSVAAAARLLRISWDEAWGVQRRAVGRGLSRKERRPPECIGVDEKAIGKGQDAYVTLVCDAKRGTVEWIAPGRKAESLGGYFEQFTKDELAAINAVAMDVWRGFTKAVQQHVPEATGKMVYDRFHVMQELNEAVDKVRKGEHRDLLARGDERLKGSKYLWLRASENVPRRSRLLFAALKRGIVKTSRAWAIKENLRNLWELKTVAGGERFFARWYFWATHSNLAPVIAAAKKLNRHRTKLLNYFRVRLTNAMSESINGRLERMKRIANGYRNVDNFRIAALFRYGGLSLLPTTH
jgi:transposase